MIPVIEGLIAAVHDGPDLDRHVQEPRWRRAALAAGRDARQRRHRLPRRPGDRRRRGRGEGRLLPDAHARRSPDDAGRPALRRRRRRGQGVPRGADGASRSRTASPRSGSCSTPGSGSARRSSTTSSCSRRLGELVELGPPGRDRDLAQVVPRQDHRPRGRRPGGGDGRHERARVRARRASVQGPRRGARSTTHSRSRLLRSARDGRPRRVRRGRRGRGRGASRARGHDRGQRACRCSRTWA